MDAHKARVVSSPLHIKEQKWDISGLWVPGDEGPYSPSPCWWVIKQKLPAHPPAASVATAVVVGNRPCRQHSQTISVKQVMGL